MRASGRRLPLLALAIAALLAGSASAWASSGGVSPGGDGERGGGGGNRSCSNQQFGQRNLSRGDCGGDVKTLNWILKAADFAVPLADNFADPTDDSVRAFERGVGQPVNGVVEQATRTALVAGMRHSKATWYGPGFYGNKTACGQRLTRTTKGVAHKRLPCGTRVVIGYQGKWVRTRVIDRGPYANGASWDLARKTARKLDFEGAENVRAGVIR